jgi:hypothetical protein
VGGGGEHATDLITSHYVEGEDEESEQLDRFCYHSELIPSRSLLPLLLVIDVPLGEPKVIALVRLNSLQCSL